MDWTSRSFAASASASDILRRTLAGGLAGLLATFGLEAFRATSFHVFEGMPGDLPRLMGVLLTDRFMLGLGQSPFPVPQPMVEELKRNAHQKAYLPVDCTDTVEAVAKICDWVAA